MSWIDLVGRWCVIAFGVVGAPCLTVLLSYWLANVAAHRAEVLMEFARFMMWRNSNKDERGGE